jgi:hypothetical protein
MFPQLFAFESPPTQSWIVVLIPALFLLTMMLIDHSMRHRYLLNRLWSLVEQDK